MPFSVANIFKKFTTQFVYLIGDEGAILVFLEKGMVVKRLFAANPGEDATKDFMELFAQHPYAPIYALVDVMDQSYVRHKLPPVSSLGLNKLVQRRLDRDFGKEDITGALNLGRDKDGRKDWNFLMISLSATAGFNDWLQLVYELPNYFAGVYLLPVECEFIIDQFARAMRDERASTQVKLDDVMSAIGDDIAPEVLLEMPVQGAALQPDKASDAKRISGLLKKRSKAESSPQGALTQSLAKANKQKSKKNKKNTSPSKAKTKGMYIDAYGDEVRVPEWQILVSHHKVGGFRQVVLRGGKMMFTRQAQSMEDAPPELIAGSVEQELQNTLEYLKRMSYNPRDGMEIFVIINEAVKGFISTNNFHDAVMKVMTPYEAAQSLGRTAFIQEGDRFSDVVIAGCFGFARKKRLKLSTAISKKFDVFYKTSLAIKLGGSVVSALLLFYMGYAGLAWLSAGDEIEQLKIQERTKKQMFDDIQKESKSIASDINLVSDLISFDEYAMESFSQVTDITSPLSKVLVNNGKMDTFSWNASNLAPSSQNAISMEKAMRIQPQYRISFTLQMVYNEESWDAFLRASEIYFRNISDVFEDYEIKHANLPGSYQQGDALQIQSDDKKVGPAQGEVYPVTFEALGPKVAAPVVAAPVAVDE